MSKKMTLWLAMTDNSGMSSGGEIFYAIGNSEEEAKDTLFKKWKKTVKDTNYIDYRPHWVSELKGIKNVDDLNSWQGVFTFKFSEVPQCILESDFL